MTRRIALILSLLPVAALTGCGGGDNDSAPPPTTDAIVNMEPAEPTPPPPPALGPVIGHVSAVYGGDNAFVGSVKAREKLPIHLNEHFYTGAETKMEVTFEGDGTTTLLDADTDPTILEKAQCLWISLTSGTMAVRNKNPICIQAGLFKGSQHSYVLYRVNGAATTVAVFEGEVTTISPPGYTVRTGQILTMQSGETTGPQPMDQETINSLQSWIPRIIL